jgi:hypothetical protein
MSLRYPQILSRRGFCIAGLTTKGGWLSTEEAYAEARNIVD